MRLLVARHGATQHNLDGRFTGQSDAPLSLLGLRQAEALATRLADLRFDAVVSSDLARARQTAEAITRHSDQPIILDPDLREISMGEWEGRAFADVVREQPDLLARIETDPTGEAPIPGGETWAQFSARVLGALTRWRERFPDGNLLWVSHGGVVSVLLLSALGLTYERRHQFRRGNTSLFELEYNSERTVILRINDTSHLERLATEEEGERFQAL
jgi:broad specificity phosphatase PhoE